MSHLIQENRRLQSLHYQFKNCSYVDVEGMGSLSVLDASGKFRPKAEDDISGKDSTFFHEILSRTRRSLQNDDESLRLTKVFDELKVCMHKHGFKDVNRT